VLVLVGVLVLVALLVRRLGRLVVLAVVLAVLALLTLLALLALPELRLEFLARREVEHPEPSLLKELRTHINAWRQHRRSHRRGRGHGRRPPRWCGRGGQTAVLPVPVPAGSLARASTLAPLATLVTLLAFARPQLRTEWQKRRRGRRRELQLPLPLLPRASSALRRVAPSVGRSPTATEAGAAEVAAGC
jgi:hypothetical protein